jgi:hypothetical protein
MVAAIAAAGTPSRTSLPSSTKTSRQGLTTIYNRYPFPLPGASTTQRLSYPMMTTEIDHVPSKKKNKILNCQIISTDRSVLKLMVMQRQCPTLPPCERGPWASQRCPQTFSILYCLTRQDIAVGHSEMCPAVIVCCTPSNIPLALLSAYQRQ